MADGSRQDGVLGQKARAAQKAFEARGMSLAKALRRALSRSADVLWDLALVCQSVDLESLDQDGVIAALAPGDLLLLLDGPEGKTGLCTVDRSVLAGVVEVQTIQQVTTLPVDADRVLTATDAAMAAPLVDATMERFAGNLEDHPLRPQLEGYRYGAMVENARGASLLLDAPAYRAFTVTVDLALGRRRGQVRLFLPERPADLPEPRDPEGAGPHEAALSLLPVRLDAVLGRIVLPLDRAQHLKPGDVLRLSPGALDRAVLLASRGHRVAGGRLGQSEGMRAVRLTWPTAPAAPLAGRTGGAEGAGAEDTPQPVPAPVPVLSSPPARGRMADPDPLADLPPLDFGSGDGWSDAEPALDALSVELDG